ncbi:MAG TPA: hypothetical protein VH481_03395 [Nitrososphaeraceae archaeon]
MVRLGNLPLISAIIAFGIFGFASIMFITVFAEPKVDISPTQGPECPGFNVVINANGFKPNSTVAVKFVGSDSKIPLGTYFDTNSTGGFNQVTFADDLKADHYKLYVGDDANSDNKFDIGGTRIYANLTIYSNATTLQCKNG